MLFMSACWATIISDLHTCAPQEAPVEIAHMQCPNLIQHRFKSSNLCSNQETIQINSKLHQSIQTISGTLYVKVNLVSRCQSYFLNIHTVQSTFLDHLTIAKDEKIDTLNAVAEKNVIYPDIECAFTFSSAINDVSKTVIMAIPRKAIVNKHLLYVVIDGIRYQSKSTSLDSNLEYISDHGLWVVDSYDKDLLTLSEDLGLESLSVEVCKNDVYDFRSGLHLFSLEKACVTFYDNELVLITQEGYIVTNYKHLMEKHKMGACEDNHELRAFNNEEEYSEKLEQLYSRIVDQNLCDYIEYHSIKNITYTNLFLQKIASTRRGLFQTLEILNSTHALFYDCVTKPNLEDHKLANASTATDILSSIAEFFPSNKRDSGEFYNSINYVNSRDKRTVVFGVDLSFTYFKYAFIVIGVIIFILVLGYFISKMAKCCAIFKCNKKKSQENRNIDNDIELSLLRSQLNTKKYRNIKLPV